MINIAIVEDEQNQISLMKSYLEKYGKEKKISFTIESFSNAIPFLNSKKVPFDLVLMDILLPDMNGMEASKKLREFNKTIVIIFVTNLANYAVKGYEVDALDFIVKPIEYDFFAMKMDKAVRTILERIGKRIMLPPKKPQIVVSSSDIVCVEVKDHDLLFHLTSGQIFRFRDSLSEIEKTLPENSFVRCANSFLVNLQHVTRINGDSLVVGKETVPLSRNKKKYFYSKLANYLGDEK